MSCSHSWKTINDIKVCINCGLTRTYDGKLLFDKKIINYKRKRVKKNERKKGSLSRF